MSEENFLYSELTYFKYGTEFQQKFVMDGEFYSGENIREAIKASFPYEDGRHKGLSRLTFDGQPTHADSELDLETLIPNIEDIDIPSSLPNRFCYGVIEGIPKKHNPAASTFFIPTDLGYICDEMN